MVVISHDTFNQNDRWRSVIVVPVSTSETQKGRGPTAVTLPKDEGGLPEESVALCHQVTTLDRGKLDTYLGTLSPQSMAELDAGIKAALNLA